MDLDSLFQRYLLSDDLTAKKELFRKLQHHNKNFLPEPEFDPQHFLSLINTESKPFISFIGTQLNISYPVDFSSLYFKHTFYVCNLIHSTLTINEYLPSKIALQYRSATMDFASHLDLYAPKFISILTDLFKSAIEEYNIPWPRDEGGIITPLDEFISASIPNVPDSFIQLIRETYPYPNPNNSLRLDRGNFSFNPFAIPGLINIPPIEEPNNAPSPPISNPPPKKKRKRKKT